MSGLLAIHIKSHENFKRADKEKNAAEAKRAIEAQMTEG